MEDAGNPVAWQNQGAGMTRKTKMKAHFSPLALRKGRSQKLKKAVLRGYSGLTPLRQGEI